MMDTEMLKEDDDFEIKVSWINSKRKIMKNLLLISLAWVFLFTAFQSMANLQSSLNSDEGLGTASLSTIYVTLVISCFFLPPILIERFGLKWTIVFSQFGYLLFIAANIYPRWSTLIPSAIILGISAGPLWTAKCTYLTETAGFYSVLSKESNEVVVNRFFGIFFCMFQFSQIIGNLISSVVLKPEVYLNSSIIVNTNACGANDCPGSQSAKIKPPQLSTVYSLCFIYIVLAFTSIVLIASFLNTYKKRESNFKKSNRFDLLVTTIQQLKNPYQLLIIPLTLWLGFSLAFMGADFTKSFVACAKGVDKVGFAMICFGLTDAIGSFIFGQLVKFLGRLPCFITAALINYMVIFIMLGWQVDLNQDYMFYLIPACWGLADAAWQTQVNSIYGVLFQSNQEAAFSNFRLWESLGFAISYAYSNYFCTRMKLNLLFLYLTIGILGYFAIEFLEMRRLNKQFNFSSFTWSIFYVLILFISAMVIFMFL